jgi:hypothetical protein
VGQEHVSHPLLPPQIGEGQAKTTAMRVEAVKK